MVAAVRPLVTVHALEGDMATDGSNAVRCRTTSGSPTPCRSAPGTRRRLSRGDGTCRVSYSPRARRRHPPRRAGCLREHVPWRRMFAPTKIWRRWHRRVNLNLRRYAVVSALAASAVPALVMARGHRIEGIPEVPLVISDSAESVEKTSSAIKILKQIGAYADAEKAKESHAIRSGKGKMRNRRYVSRRGPLIVYGTEGAKIVKAFRNIPGVDVMNVERLNLLKLAPGGHLGRFIVWTKSAFERLDAVFGTFDKASERKNKYVLPRSKMSNSDLSRIINSDEVQSVVRPIKTEVKRKALKKNPLKNLNAMLKLNPYAKTARRVALLTEAQRIKSKKEKLDKKRTKLPKEEAAAIRAAGKSWYHTMISDSDYTEFENFSKWLGATQ
ncbi:unnamed protein product [Spirodela intermedia]|uniref:Large ribosomal subunit protein uL4 C-terminal domain-containing protein n=1 Tax=Spirodela intermedia TaxID=51605 RepID=A0A7I8I8C0_SPIIN|nr:unnamed protein product [Spirodela intermedia]CAA6653724.1 unnamed protein product [Spirodela intermedia]